jgi:hypothetical protein
MSLAHQSLLAFSTILTIFLAGCGLGSDGIRITEGQLDSTAIVTSAYANDTGLVVHVDLFERIATIRNGHSLGQGFLIATDYSGAETSILKRRPSSLSEGLPTADILEGEPGINNAVRPASEERSTELAKIYRDPAEEN